VRKVAVNLNGGKHFSSLGPQGCMHYRARVCGGKVGTRDAINHIKTERYTFNGRADGHRC
jgi:hypothetical protein